MERERESGRMGKRGNERERERQEWFTQTLAKLRPSLTSGYIARVNELAPADDQGLLQARRGMAVERTRRETREREKDSGRERENGARGGETRARDATKGEKDRGLSPVRVRREDGGESAE